MPLELRKPYQLRTSDFDRYGRIKPASVLDIFQDVAGLQAEDMGIGRDRLLSEGVFWVVVRMKYEVVRQPQLHDLVIARTWPYGPSRFTFQRDYSMLDEAGGLLVKAASEWTLMDLQNRTLAKVTDHCATDGDYSSDRSFEKRLRRVATFDAAEATQEPCSVTPRASDLDINGHVNNARYAAFVFDALDLGEGESVRSMQIDFKHEVLAGQPLVIQVKRAEGQIHAMGVNNAGDVAFACEIILF